MEIKFEEKLKKEKVVGIRLTVDEFETLCKISMHESRSISATAEALYRAAVKEYLKDNAGKI